MFYNLSLKKRIPIFILLFVFILVFLDWLFFSFLFFKFPNELEWDTSPWYNFIHRRKNFPQKSKIFILGSSVAMYGVVAKELDSHAEFYSHVAMSPTDVYYYAEDIIQKKPEKLIYILNPGDFQMDHFLEKKENEFHYSEEDRIRAYAKRHPVRFIYPFRFILDNFSSLHKKEILDLLTKSFLNVNRFRSFLYDPIENYIEHHFRSGRSYHNYIGIEAGSEQVSRKGWIGKEFSFKCENLQNNKISEIVFIPENDFTLKIKILDQEKSLHFNKSGWQKFEIDLPSNFTPNENIHIHSDKLVSSHVIDQKLYGKEFFYSLRLSQNFCKKTYPQNISYLRVDSQDDFELESMSIEDYQKDYQERMYKDGDVFLDNEKKVFKRPEIQRLYKLHRVKKFLGSIDRELYWSEFEYFKKAIQKFQKNGISIYIFNHPENPIELKIYRQSYWYNQYISFLRNLESERVYFEDDSEYFLDPRKFIDSHHLTFKASVEMSKIYSKKLNSK
jgi:hypothetical protein